MEHTDRPAALVGMDAHEVNELLELFADQELVVTRAPKCGLIMMTVQDSFGSDFHLGEVLVTEAAVSLGGIEGFGMVAGEEPRKALARAAADAVLRAGHPEPLCQAVLVSLTQARQRQAACLAGAAALTASSRVSFDLMPGA
jgi:alpha-D-ribose 1-methylphosphonate 5-triphosphate synthase subunit PhnG